MASIGLIPLHETGHVNATLRLSNELVEAGHDVRYIALHDDAEAHFARQGLPLVRVQLEPSGSAPVLPDAPIDLQGFDPEVVLVDSVHDAVSMFIAQRGVTVLKLSTTFPQRHNPRIPPISSDLFPATDTAAEHAIAAAWEEQRRRNAECGRTEGARRTAREFGFPLDRLDEASALGVTCRLPELALVPEALEFPGGSAPDLFFAGPCVELSRPEPSDLPFPLPSHDRKLIYVSFGTQLQRYPALPERLEAIIGAARCLQDLQFVLALPIVPTRPLPPNVLRVDNAPQLSLLRRASLMIAHGGLNGVKEALCCGVPLIVLPFDQDQPGTAARVQYHGLGRYLSWSSVSAEGLAATVRDLLGDIELTRRVTQLSRELQAALIEKHAARAFERCWAAARASSWHGCRA